MNTNDFVSRGYSSSSAPQASVPGNTPDNGKKQKKRFEYLKMGTAALIFSTALLSATLLAFIVFGKGSRSEADFIKKDNYQAVFLDDQNGQVYFGKLSVANNKFYHLTDIFYVRVEQVQPGNENNTNQNISLAKLGNELHGPEDEMFIARDKVLFWENLKDDGQVVEAIKTFKENGGKSTENSGQNSSGNTQPTQNQNAASGTEETNN